MWNHGCPSQGRRRRGEPVTVSWQHQAVSTLRTFFDDLIFWEWPDRPPRPLVHASGLPRLLQHIPRALAPTVDTALMARVARIDDVAARSAIRILRGTGMRLGELLELELDCLLGFSARGTWSGCLLASSEPSELFRWMRRPLELSTTGWPIEAASDRCHIPALASQPICCS